MKLKWKKVVALISIATLGATLAGCTQYDHKLMDSELKVLKDESRALGRTEGYNQAVDEIDITADNQIAIETFLANATEQDLPLELVEDILASVAEVEEEIEAEAQYIIDELKIGSGFSYNLSDRQISSLFDGEVKFDGDNYDAVEVVHFAGFIATNEDDYNGRALLEIEEEQVSYTVKFENSLNTLEISEEETLEFTFLGKDVEVSEWTSNEITFTTGTTYDVEEGQVITVNDVEIQVSSVGVTGDTGFVRIVIGEDSEIIKVGETEEIAGLEIKLSEVLINDEPENPDDAVLEIGDKVEFEIEKGDNYNEEYVWDFDANSLSVVLDVDFNDLDDEDEQPFLPGESISLPDNFLVFTYDGLIDHDTEKVTFELDKDYAVELDGSFVYELDDFERVWANETGFYDNDDEFIAFELEIDNTDFSIVNDGTYLTMGDVTVNLELDTMKIHNGTEWLVIDDDDEDYLSPLGFIVEDVEDSLKDNEFTVIVPEEDLTAEVSVY